MKTIKSYPLLLAALVLTLCLSACGSKDGGQEEYRAPDIIEDAVYDPDAQGDYSDYFGKWVGIRDCEYTTMLVTPADGGMRFELYKDDRLAASGSAQQVPGHAFIYFFNDADGSAYLFASNNGDMELYSFGYFELKVPAPNTKGGFEDIAGTWYLGGDPNAESVLDIDNNGEWVLYEGSAVVDNGYLVQHDTIKEDYYAHSRQNEDVCYDMSTSLDREGIWWGSENDAYLKPVFTKTTAELMQPYVGYWSSGEDYWLRIYAGTHWDTVDAGGEIINTGDADPREEEVILYMVGYGYAGSLVLQADGSLKNSEDGMVFSPVAEADIPAALKELIDKKREKPFKLTYADGQEMYIVIGEGPQKGGGYSVAVKALYETDNSIVIRTELMGPEAGEAKGTENSYPVLIVKTEYRDKPVVFR